MIYHNGYNLGVIKLEHLHEYWPICSKFFEPALEDNYGLATMEQLRIMCFAEQFQVWAITDKDEVAVGAFCTVVHGPDQNILDIVYLGGDNFKDWGQALMRKFEANAKKQGITVMRICGRKGWGKLFPSYKEQDRTIAKYL